MTPPNAAPPRAPRAPLPVEPRSQSALLSSSHLFTAQVVSASASPWGVGQDGIEHRRIQMDLRLVAILKGRFAVPVGQTFSATVPQNREGALVRNDYQGLWSHARPGPSAGVIYFLVSSSPETAPADPARLIQEDVCKQILLPALANDVGLAEQGEQHYQGTLAAGGDHAPCDAGRALLCFADAHASEGDVAFAGYLWDRISSPALSDQSLRSDLLALLSKPETSPAVRFELLVDVERLLPDVQAKDPGFALAAGRTMIALLLEPKAAAVAPRIVSVSLFHLVFPDETTARFTAADLAPNPADRSKIDSLLRASATPQAKQLSQWISR